MLVVFISVKQLTELVERSKLAAMCAEPVAVVLLDHKRLDLMQRCISSLCDEVRLSGAITIQTLNSKIAAHRRSCFPIRETVRLSFCSLL